MCRPKALLSTPVTPVWRLRGDLQKEHRCERRTNATNAVATRWELHRTPCEILERQSAFLFDMLKSNAVTRRSNKSGVGTP